MPLPRRSDDELREIARDLATRGRLTYENLRMDAGGGSYTRLAPIVRAVETEVAARAAAAATPLPVIPERVEMAVAALVRAVGTEIDSVRSTEAQRTRLAIGAAEEAARVEVARLQAQIADALAERGRLEAEVRAFETRAEDAEAALGRKEDELRHAAAQVADLVNAHERELDGYRSEARGARQDLAVAESARTEAVRHLAAARAELESTEAALRSARDQRDRLAGEAERERAHREVAESRLREAVEQRKTAEAAVREANAACTRAEQDLARIQGEAQTLRGLLQEARGTTGEARKRARSGAGTSKVGGKRQRKRKDAVPASKDRS